MSQATVKNKFLGIREIAQIAGVSTATVSRVINHPEQCSENTRQKVEEIIREYNYVPNETIKHIFSKSSNTIAVFIHDIQNPFYSHLIMELNSLCFREHYTLFICDTENDIDKEQAYLESCLAKRCTGIILTEGVSHQLFNDLDIPIVALDRKNLNLDVPVVSSENYYIIRKLVSYLCNLGHHKIAFVAPKRDLVSIERRFKGYQDELEARNIEPDPEYIFLKSHSLSPTLGREALQHFLSLPEPPTAIICANDMIALGVINEAALMNIRIPDMLSVCGFDHVIDDYLPTPLTTVEQNIPQLALELFQAIVTPEAQPTQAIIESKLILGHTCARVKK